MLTDSNGKELDTEQRGLKVRLSQVYKMVGQTMLEFMAELKFLTDDDERDFRRWFTVAGYPTT